MLIGNNAVSMSMSKCHVQSTQRTRWCLGFLVCDSRPQRYVLWPLKAVTDGFQTGKRTPRHFRGTSKGTQDTLRLKDPQREPLGLNPEKSVLQLEVLVLWGEGAS